MLTLLGADIKRAPIECALEAVILLKPVVSFLEMTITEEAAVYAQRGGMLQTKYLVNGFTGAKIRTHSALQNTVLCPPNPMCVGTKSRDNTPCLPNPTPQPAS